MKERLPWLRALAAGRFELLAGALVLVLGIDLALDVTGAEAPGRHVALAAVLAAGAVALAALGSRERRRRLCERQEAEDALRASTARLEEIQRLEERLRLGQRLEAVGRLAGGVAHDFNNFLTAILGYCDLLSLRLGKDHPLLREVGEIRRAGRRAAGLIEQLLAFSRRQVIAPRVLDLNATVADASRLIRRLIGEDIDLECRLEPEPLLVEADPSQLEQVLLNLAANARDAMPAGGRLVLATERRRLHSARPGDMFEVAPGEYCRLTVRDTGEGMDEETLAHLFEPFYTTKEIGRGTGLGLASVYGAVKQNRGYIWVESAPGKGSSFEIFLPRALRPAQPLAAEHAADPGLAERPAGEATILLVEDEDSVRSLIGEVLARRGYRVLEAENAARAFERASHPGKIDLMVTDLVMPGVQGDALARRLTRERPDLAVLYISGYSESVLTERGLLPEGRRLLHKPFTPDELVAAVAEALESAPPTGPEPAVRIQSS